MRYTLEESSYYQTDVLDQHDFNHLLMFRKTNGK